MSDNAMSPSWTSINIADDYFSNTKQATSVHNVSNSSEASANIVVPSAKQIHQDTIDGIKLGVLPEYHDYGVVMEYLVDMFMKHDFHFQEVLDEVPWLSNWLASPYNSNLLNEELETAANMEVAKLISQIKFLREGGCCTRNCGKCCGCICCFMPPLVFICKLCTFFTDMFMACTWATYCDWWLGRFYRQYILPKTTYCRNYISTFMENYLYGDILFEDEDLNLKNVYDSNSYTIANHYACFLFLAIVLLTLGTCFIIVSYVYLPMHQDKLFIRAESIIGVILLSSGCCGLQFYCRCTL